jgi:two-component system sensor histidine kinase ChvG
LARSDEKELALRWSGRIPLTARILLVNILALAVLAGGFFYLDSYRSRLLDRRVQQVADQTLLIAEAVRAAPAERRAELLRRFGQMTKLRLRVYPDSDPNAPPFDSWRGGEPTYILRDPTTQPWQRHVARAMDRTVDFIVGADPLAPFTEPVPDRLAAWPEALAVLSSPSVHTQVREAEDITPVISAAVPLEPVAASGGSTLLATINARDVTRVVRAERFRLGLVLAGVTLLSILLSLFLARTIARPLRRLARAAVQVRMGRAREVSVPRLPARRDEIGMLARALYDMTQSLRYRIDATEAFAADVTHELKNPLASLRSAVDSLDRVPDRAAQQQLLEIIRSDVVRLDRLVVDVAEVSRLDAELSRARFEPVDLGRMLESLLSLWEPRAAERRATIAFARPRVGTAVVMGEESRLARVFDNIVDNAISFSPEGGLIEIAAVRVEDDVIVTVEDEGSGVPAGAREAIFNRFHSIRPEGEAFGRHSGLGLAIAKAIVEGHDGTIAAEDRRDGRSGARFVIRFRGVSQ